MEVLLATLQDDAADGMTRTDTHQKKGKIRTAQSSRANDNYSVGGRGRTGQISPRG